MIKSQFPGKAYLQGLTFCTVQTKRALVCSKGKDHCTGDLMFDWFVNVHKRG